jgi:hypothetical protein
VYVILAWVSLGFAIFSTLVSVVCVYLVMAERKTVEKLVKSLELWHRWYRENFNGGCALPPPPEPVDMGNTHADNRMSL